MAGRRMIYGGDGAANTNTLLVSSSYEPSDSLFLSGSSPSFLGSRSMVSFEDVNAGKRLDRPFFRSFDQEENVDEEFDEYFHQPEKKRRLTADQVQFLEKSFEIENKLEPERKVQLAKDLGLQPRQVAIWFQNRRARWKTKQLEKDYEVLQSRYNSLKSDYDGLLEEKEQLNAEVVQLTDKLLRKQNGNANSDSLDSNQQSQSPPRDLIVDSVSEGEVSRKPILNCKLEDPSSTKSDVLDSDSPPYIDGGNSSLIEAGDTSYVFEPDQSDLSQDEDDNLSKKMLGPSCYVFPKIEDNNYPDPDPLANSCYFAFSNEDQEFGFWP